jgi:hypothetical protein
MSATLVLVAVSALGGLALALFRLRWGALAISGLILAIAAAVVLQARGFGFIAGVAIIVGCLSINQISYLIGTVLITRAWEDPESSLTSDQPDDHPGERSHKDIAGEHKQHDETPPRSDLPND